MRIVHIANFYSEKSGGIKTTINQLGILYQRIGHEFFYIVPGEKHEVELTPNGTKITMPSIPIPFSGGYRIIRSNRAIKQTLSLLRPERLEVSDRLSLRKIGTWAKKRKIRTIVFSHESLEALLIRFFKFGIVRRYAQWHNRRLAASFDWVVASTEYAAREFRTQNVSNLKRVPLGVDLDSFQPSHRSRSLRNKLLRGSDILLVHCGRLSVEKNPEQSIAVLKKLNEIGFNARLIFVGMGPLFNKLKKSALGHPVEFTGYVAGPKKVASYLANADVVLAPGPHETFCLAALEALACGTPVVASNKSAVKEILCPENEEWAGVVCGEDPVEWAQAVGLIVSDRKFRVHARNRAEQYPWTQTIKALDDLHEHTTKNNVEERNVKEKSAWRAA